jgi:hypothetical protein
VTGIEVGVAIIIGILIGRFLPARRRTPKPALLICGCRHHHSYHDPATGKCGWAGTQYLGENEDGIRQYESRYCSCKQYSGPVPLPEYVARELSDGA